MSVVSMVVGAVTQDSARVVTKVSAAGDVRLAVSTSSDMSNPTYFGPVTPDAQNVASVTATGRTSDVKHWCQVEHAGVLDTARTGRFRTDPPLGTPTSFEVVVAGDAGATPEYPGEGTLLASSRMSNHPVFDTIRLRDPRRFIHPGDLHYYDLSSGNWGIGGGASLANYRRAYDDVLLQPRQHQLYREIPWVYTFDDHDFLGNDKRGLEDTVGAANALAVYKERVPHYPLPNPSDNIGQSFEIGRVLFIVTDCRSKASANSAIDNSSKTMLGSTQKTWVESVLRSSDAAFLVFVVSSQWTATTFADSWASFATERAELVNLFRSTGWAERMCCVYPDRHAAGLDMGRNTDGNFPLLMAASLDATPSDPPSFRFDTGYDFPGRNQYGTVTVNDWGKGLVVTLAAWQGTSRLIAYSTAVNT